MSGRIEDKEFLLCNSMLCKAIYMKFHEKCSHLKLKRGSILSVIHENVVNFNVPKSFSILLSYFFKDENKCEIAGVHSNLNIDRFQFLCVFIFDPRR